MPAWLSADKVISQEAERRLLAPTDRLDTVYHYTSAAALERILDDCSLWLTDFEYFNDATELRHGSNLTQEAIQEAIAGMNPNSRPSFLAAWLDALQSDSCPRISMACFSRDGDSLSQWRAYGAISIGFGSPFGFGYLPETQLDRVVYDDTSQRLILRLFIHHHAAAWSVDARHVDQPTLDAYHSLDRLYRRLIFLKNPAFADEREVRLVYIENPDLFRRVGRPVAPKRFRTRGNLVIPYVRTADLAREPVDHLPIREIVVGPQPNSDLVESGIRQLLAARGYASVTVRSSSIPYRPISVG